MHVPFDACVEMLWRIVKNFIMCKIFMHSFDVLDFVHHALAHLENNNENSTNDPLSNIPVKHF